MKFKILSVLFAIALILGSCKKEETKPNPGNEGNGGTEETKQKVVTMYGAEWCGKCKSLKAQLIESKIEFTEKNTGDDAVSQEIVDRLLAGGFVQSVNGSISYSIPVVDIEGEILYGADANITKIKEKI